MNDWFTVEKIDNDTFVISEYKHWEETHCYLLNGTYKSLLIDTGLGVGNIKKVIDTLTELPVMVVTTHVHWDHIGGHKHFDNIGAYESEKDWLDSHFPISLNIIKKNLCKGSCEFPEDFEIEDYEIYQGGASFLLHENDIISLGNRNVKVIHTPGHSPGHVCFYEEEREFLYTGDLVYEGTLDVFYPSTNPYEFMLSIKKIKVLSIKKVLPGHHRLDICPDLILDIDKGFTELYNSGRLIQGNGMYYFKTFNLHI